jgi:type IV pilus assembly protein PilB
MSTVPEEKLRKIVLDTGLVTDEAWEDARKNAARRRRDVAEVLIERGLVGSQYLFDLLSEHYGVPFVDLRRTKVDRDAVALLTEDAMNELKAVPFAAPDKKTLDVAMLRPDDKATIGRLEKATKRKIRPHLTSKKSLQFAVRLYQRDLAGELHEILRVGEEAKKGSARDEERYPVIKVVDTVLAYGVMSGASDIHLEPLADGFLVRFRIDGQLRDMLELPLGLAASVVARVKILANLKIDEHVTPQDGRFSFFADEEDVFVRVSLLPTFYGEKAVLRILSVGERSFGLEELGFSDHDAEAVRAQVAEPQGLILVVGPTGSGKTTTLYALVNMLNTEKVNISTIEDPIEYGLPRINQTQVNAQVGYTFAGGLRALLRQDPNVIMVGEIRDAETAAIAMQAGLTGHLVVSTLHANDTLGVLPRLLDMDVRPFIIASTLNVAIAQRLLRGTCVDCMESCPLSEADATALAARVDVSALLAQLKKKGIVSKDVSGLADLTFYRGKGCARCGGSGYAGRVGVYEVLVMDEALRNAVVAGASPDELRRIAVNAGMVTLIEDGWLKVLSGRTTVAELLRVIGS